MRLWSVAAVATAAFAATRSSGARRSRHSRIRAPHFREFGRLLSSTAPVRSGAVPLTLEEAVAKGTVQVIETGRVNELQIENTGTEQVFVQAGDIVKGGKQDRVLTVSFLLPAKSGRLPMASFCVEQGRWTVRGKEDASKFSSAAEAMPSRAALLAMAAPPRPRPAAIGRPARSLATPRWPPSKNRSGIRSRPRKTSWRAASTAALLRRCRAPACSSRSRTRS